MLRYAFRVAETGFDPAQISDLYSRTVAANIFEAPYAYDFLARPVRLRPNTAVALPEVAADFKTFTFRVRPGIYFTDDPAFKGSAARAHRGRLRLLDQAPLRPALEEPAPVQPGEQRDPRPDELRQAALDGKKPFDYDTRGRRPARARPLHVAVQAGRAEPALHRRARATRRVTGAVAREVVEAYGDRIMEHPVGTGPFRLGQWRRSSLIVLESNPDYRDDVLRRGSAAPTTRSRRPPPRG